MSKYLEFAKKLDLNFNKSDVIEQVFVHRSYLNEHSDFKLGNNERLEFLGDAVLELVVTDYLFKYYQNEQEGVLTSFRSALVRRENLAQVAKKIELNEYLLLSHGEEKNNGRENDFILANTFEALVGAIYLDLGYGIAEDFIKKQILTDLEDLISRQKHLDAKSRLQEMFQAEKGITPNYQVLKEQGPDHAKEFIVGVFAGENKLAEGFGSSKQKAESSAAEKALENYSD